MNKNEKKKILVVSQDKGGVSYYRSTTPHIILENNSDDFIVDIVHPKDLELNNIEYFKQYSIVHFSRTIIDYDQMPTFLEHLKSEGIITVMDIDDHWTLSPHHPSFKLIKDYGIDKKVVNNIRHSDFITTTTEIFAKEIRKYNKNVFVIPNSISKTDKQFIPKPTTSDRVRIGWLGGSSHYYDLQLLSGLVNKIKAAGLIDKVQFVLCGFDTRGKEKVRNAQGEIVERPANPLNGVWYQYEKIFTDNHTIISDKYNKHLHKFTKEEFEGIENEPYRRVWTKPVSSYGNNYNLFDISLAPLEDNLFNKVKSQLKIVEAGFHKKAIIAQDFGPYQIDGVSAYKKGGSYDLENGNSLLVNINKNHKEWFKYVKELILNEELRNKISENLHELVTSKYSLETVTKTRANFYNNIINKKND